MLRESKRVFDMYMNEQGFNNNKMAVLMGVYKKLERWETIKNKDIIRMSKDEIINLCQDGNDKIANRSYGAMKTRVDAINDILKWLKADMKLSMRDFDTMNKLDVSTERYFTKEEIKDICDLFINPQDKFIVYGLFSGIYGKGYKDLLELKVKDIDLENKIINTPSGKQIKMDSYLYDIVKDTIDPVWGATYYKYIKQGNEGTTTDNYDLNMSSEYVLKPKPYSKNCNGLDPMKVNGIQRRLLKLSEETRNSFDLKEDSDFSLNGIDLVRSGIMHNMYIEEQENNKKWTCASLQDWLKENNIKSQVFELYRIYNSKYKSLEKQSVN